MSLFNKIRKSSSDNEENPIGVNLLSKEQKISLLGMSCYLCSPIFIQEDKANDYCMILLAFTQMLGLNEKELLEVGKNQDASNIQQYVDNIRTIQKEKSLILFDVTCQELISLSDNKNFISIAYKRILMDIGYSSEESGAILDRVYFGDRDIEAYKPNNDSSSVSDIDIMIDYCSKQRQKAEDKIKELQTSISEQKNYSQNTSNKEDSYNNISHYTNTTVGHILDNTSYFDEESEDWSERPFIYNWKFSKFIKGCEDSVQIKEVVNKETGDLYQALVILDEWNIPLYIKLLDNYSLSEIMDKKENFLIGITINGNFWLHNGRIISAYEYIY